jgi:hypothetical protein
MSLPRALTVRAGRTALARLERDGFRADAFSTMLGASGGPKWLVLGGIDRVLVRRFVAGRTKPLHMFGTSIGAFRHSCHAHLDPLAAFERFEEAYVGQAYETKPTPQEVTDVSRRILDLLLAGHGADEMLSHPTIRLHVGTVRSRGLTAFEAKPVLAAGLGIAATANALSRGLLGLFFERVVFHSTPAAEFRFTDMATTDARLQADNLRAAILASGSIPMVMAAIVDPPGAPRGLYRDGGITDYHFAMDFDAPEGLVLYPHFFDRIVPGWFDKPLKWRKATGALLDRTVFLAPSREFVATLPGAKVPDRDDFVTHPTAERQRRWHEAIARSRQLGEELEELMEGDRLAQAARPFDD